MTDDARRRAATLPIWRHRVEPEVISGGLSNQNFLVSHAGEKFVVRVGDDVPVHGVRRVDEAAASRAAHAVGISPEVVHVGPGVLVLRHVSGRTLTPDDLRQRSVLERIVPVLRTCHTELRRMLGGEARRFDVFAVIRSYVRFLEPRAGSLRPRLDTLLASAQELATWVGAMDDVFGHNDLLAANLIDDGTRVWLIDWEYGGLSHPLFDLSGLASNNGLDGTTENWLLETYFARTIDASLRRRFDAMKCAALLREALWGAVSAQTSALPIDYDAYATEYLERFERARARLEEG